LSFSILCSSPQFRPTSQRASDRYRIRKKIAAIPEIKRIAAAELVAEVIWEGAVLDMVTCERLTDPVLGDGCGHELQSLNRSVCVYCNRFFFFRFF
jgi:hypothetical protein